TRHDGAVATDHDRSLDEDRVGDHRVEDGVAARAIEPELLPAIFAAASDRGRVVGAEEREDALELRPRRCRFQVADVVGVDAALFEDALRRAALRAARVEPGGYVSHHT